MECWYAVLCKLGNFEREKWEIQRYKTYTLNNMRNNDVIHTYVIDYLISIASSKWDFDENVMPPIHYSGKY